MALQKNNISSMKKLYISVLSSFVIIAAMAQSFTATRLPNQYKLPESGMRHIMQDSEGYMWYSLNNGGFCRDNGYQIDVFRNNRKNPNLLGRSSRVTQLVEDLKGNICIGTYNGAFYLDKKDYSIRCIDDSLLMDRVATVLPSSDGTYWIATERTVNHYDKSFKLMNSYSPVSARGMRGETRLYEDSHNILWATMRSGGICRYNKANDKFEAFDWNTDDTPNNMVEDRHNNCYWISSFQRGLLRFVPSDKDLHSTITAYDNLVPGTKEINSSRVCLDVKRNILWVVTGKDLYALDVKEKEPSLIDLSNAMERGDKVIDYVMVDRRNDVWVASTTPSSFILHEDTKSIKRYDIPQFRQMGVLGSYLLYAMGDNEYKWFLHKHRGLTLYNSANGNVSFANDDPDLTLRNVKSNFNRCSDGKGLWMHSTTKVFRVWNEGMKIYQKDILELPGEHIRGVADDGKGHLFVGYGGGVKVYNIKSGIIESNTTTETGNIREMVASSDGIFAISAVAGLIHCDRKGKVSVISDRNDFYHIAYSNNQVWVSDQMGSVYVYSLDDKTLTLCENIEKTLNAQVISMTFDIKGHLWLLSSQKILEYDPRTESTRLMTAQNVAINQNAFYGISSDKSNIYVAGTDAFLEFKPSTKIEAQEKGLKPVFTTVHIDDEKVFVSNNNIDIPSNATSVEVFFSAFDILNASQTYYSYRTNKNEDWHYLPQGVNYVSFTNMSKGTYTIEVRCTDSSGCWSEHTATITLHRLPAWWETWFAYITYLLIIIVISIYLSRWYLSSQQEKRKLMLDQRLADMKFRFFTNISHELRTPLTLVITPLETLVKRRQMEEEAQHTESAETQSLTNILRNANSLLDLVNRLLDFRKLEMGEQKLTLSNGNVFMFIRSSVEAFRPLAQKQGIALGYNVPEKVKYMNFDSNKLHHILYNLLSNAIKFTPEGGTVTVTASIMADNKLRITVADTGCGISDAELPHVFERYYQSESGRQSHYAGTGIGLHIVYEFALLHQGEVSVQSKEGEGTVFTVTLPANLQASDENTIIATGVISEEKTAPETDEEKSVRDNPDHKSILLVDDNAELLDMLSSELCNTYNIYKAQNGTEALDIVKRENINMVISDIMMPEMDGYELCSLIKQNVETSHIVVILLTAKSAQEAQLEGFKSGADAYLSKPFSMEMLNLRIKNMLELQAQRIEKFQTDSDLIAEDLTTNPVDEEFMNRAMRAVEKNLSNNEYDIDLFASDLCMSRTSLYRKFESLTGQKPTEFIRSFRLKRAAQMLREGRMNISEIADCCGFSSASYFNKRFKEMYGIQPSLFK